MSHRPERRRQRIAAVLRSAIALLIVASPAGADPALDYMLQCQGCHMADGSGSPGSVPDLRQSLGRLVERPEGRAFLIRVPGSAQSPLSDQKLAEVLTWMVRRFGGAAVSRQFRPFTAQEVSQHRRPLLDVASARRRLLRE